jgi:hypothetical protein
MRASSYIFVCSLWLFAPGAAQAAGECSYQLDPVWEVLRPLRSSLATHAYNAAFQPEIGRIDGLFKELDAWIVDATAISRQYCEPMAPRVAAAQARNAAFGARCQGEIKDQAVYDGCVAERASLQQEWAALQSMNNTLVAQVTPLNARGMDLIARAKAAADEIQRSTKDSGAALTKYTRFIQSNGGTADSCRSLSEIIGTAARHHAGNSTRVIDDLATAITGTGGSGFTGSGFKPEFRNNSDPAFRTVTWLALGFRGGATGDDAIDKAAATLGRELTQNGNAAGLGAAVRARICGT